MPCVNCQASTNVPPGGLTPNDICNGKYINTDCVLYRGEPLTEIQAETNDSVTTILTTLDTIIGTIIAGSFTANNGLSKNTSTNVQWGGPLLFDTSIISTNYYSLFTGTLSTGFSSGVLRAENSGTSPTLRIINSNAGSFTSGTGIYVQTDGGYSIYARNNNGYASFFLSFNGYGSLIQANDFVGSQTGSLWSSSNDVKTVAEFSRYNSTGTIGSDGVGVAIELQSMTNQSAITAFVASTISALWTTAAQSTRTSRFEITTVNSGTQSRKLAIAGSGQLILDNYTTSTSFASVSNSSVGVLNVDNAGNVFVGAGGGGGITTANNGLRASTSTNVQLGGLTAPGEPLLQNTYIDASTFGLFLTGSVTASTGILNVSQTNAGANNAIVATSVAGLAISGTSISNSAIYGSSTSGYGGSFTSASSSGLLVTNTATTTTTALILGSPSSTNNLKTILTIDRSSSGTAANGIGGSIDYSLKTSLGVSELSNRISSKWTNVISANRTSVLEFYGVYSGGAISKNFAIEGSGTLWTQLAAFDNNAAAVAFGLTVGQVYMTTGLGASPLNVAGIMMVVQ